jgi:hypothetical protein
MEDYCSAILLLSLKLFFMISISPAAHIVDSFNFFNNVFWHYPHPLVALMDCFGALRLAMTVIASEAWQSSE